MSPAIRTLGILCFCTFFGRLSGQNPAVDLAWSTYLSHPTTLAGGYLEDMILDPDGNILITGVLAGDAVVFKLDASGSFLHWVYTFGGSHGDRGKALALGPDRSIYVIGQTVSVDFPVTPTAFQTSHGDATFGSNDVFVARIAPSGDSLLYASYFGGLGDDYPGDLDVNAAGDCFVGGYTVGGFIPTTSGAFDETFNGAVGFTDAYVFRTTPTFDQLTYSTFIGGSQSESIASLVVNEDDEVTFCGQVNSPDFPVTPGAVFFFKTGTSAATNMTRLSADGSQILASTYYSGNSSIHGEAMCLTPEGDAIIVGKTYASLMPLTPGTIDSTYHGDADAFMIRISKDATTLEAASYYGGSEWDSATDVAINDRGEVFVIGTTSSLLDFPISSCVRDSVWGGTNNFWGGDAFLLKLDSSMENVIYSSFHGGSLDESHPVLLIDGSSCNQSIILGMGTSSDDFPTTPGAVIDQWQPGVFIGISHLQETLDVAIVSDSLPCLVNGQPYPMAVTYNTCGPWSDVSTWQWNLGDGRTLIDSAIAPAFTVPGTNTITVGLPGCPPAATLDLDLFAVELGPDLEVCAQANTLLTPNAPGAVSFWWQDGSTSSSHEVDRSGWVWVEVTNAQGCEARDSIQVDLIGEDDIIPPNAFTPNGDQINDVFFVTGMENQRFDLYVYDRWGKEVYSATPYNNDWGGSNLPEGVYYYSLTSPDRCGTYMNWVTLVR